MTKKRVHEMGKQLKEHGIEFSTQELVEKLHALGYHDVKSHSSSLEDDQAAAAFDRILGERKPKPPPARPTGPGFVVRKRAHDAPPAHPGAAPDEHALAAPVPMPEAPEALPPEPAPSPVPMAATPALDEPAPLAARAPAAPTDQPAIATAAREAAALPPGSPPSTAPAAPEAGL